MRCEAARMLKPDGLCLPQALIDWCIFETYFEPEEVVVRQKTHQQFYRMEMLIQSMHRHSAMDI